MRASGAKLDAGPRGASEPGRGIIINWNISRLAPSARRCLGP